MHADADTPKATVCPKCAVKQLDETHVFGHGRLCKTVFVIIKLLKILVRRRYIIKGLLKPIKN